MQKSGSFFLSLSWSRQMKRSNLLAAVFLIVTASSLFGATGIENARSYTQAARVSLDSGFFETAAEYADTALIYCDSLSDAWYLKALAEENMSEDRTLTDVIDMLEHAFRGGSFWMSEDDFAARMWLSSLCYTTGRYERAAELLEEEPAVTEEKLLLTVKVWYALGEKENARACIERGIQMYPSDWEFYNLFFVNENPEEVKDDPLCMRLTGNVALFDPSNSDIYLYASSFVDEETSSRYVKLYGQYRASNPLYPICALEKGFMSFSEALTLFDSLCHNNMLYSQFEMLCSLAGEQDYEFLYAFLDGFDGLLLFDTEGTGLQDMMCAYRYGRPYTVYYDKDNDADVEMLVSCDYGTPVFVYLPSKGISLSYNRYPSVSQVTFTTTATTLDFARNACEWKAVTMQKASFSTETFAFYIPVLADALADVTPVTFVGGCSIIECASDDPAGCSIRIVMNGGKPVDTFYTVHDKLYAHGYFRDGKLLYRDVDMDGDGFFELSEQYLYDAAEPDPALIGNRIYGTVADCFECPRFATLLSDGDGDGVYEYEETIAPDGTSEIVWY